MDPDVNRALIVAGLARVAGGDRTALQTVYRLTSARLFGVCLRILGERSEAEDVLQEVYLTVWRKAGDFKQSDDLADRARYRSNHPAVHQRANRPVRSSPPVSSRLGET